METRPGGHQRLRRRPGAFLYGFQQEIVQFACRGRAAILADCGLGKTLMQLEWARQVCEHTRPR
jgi:hypothetical protein